jgi:hypothetical protein
MDPENVKKISNPALRAYYERHQTQWVSILIEDVDSVRVDPAAPGSPIAPWRRPPWRRDTGAEQTA